LEETVVVFVTASSVEEGEKIARGLLEKRLAACVNVVSPVKSFYWWRGKIEEAGEVLLIIKTRRRHLNSLMASVVELHSYEVPEIVSLPILDGSPEYLKWVLAETEISL